MNELPTGDILGARLGLDYRDQRFRSAYPMENRVNMKCPKCEAEVLDDALFCQRCGENLRSDSSQSADTAPAATPTVAERFKEGVKTTNVDNDRDPEEELWVGGYSGKAMYGNWLIAIVLSIVIVVAAVFMTMSTIGVPGALGAVVLLVLLWGGMFCIFLYRKWSAHYELTSQRFIHREGILKRTTDRIEVIDMDDVTYSQGIVQRMLGVGSIRITSSDRSHPELTLIGIADVQRVAGLIDDVRRQERRRRGLHIEAI